MYINTTPSLKRNKMKRTIFSSVKKIVLFLSPKSTLYEINTQSSKTWHQSFKIGKIGKIRLTELSLDSVSHSFVAFFPFLIDVLVLIFFSGFFFSAMIVLIQELLLVCP